MRSKLFSKWLVALSPVLGFALAQYPNQVSAGLSGDTGGNGSGWGAHLKFSFPEVAGESKWIQIEWMSGFRVMGGVQFRGRTDSLNFKVGLGGGFDTRDFDRYSKKVATDGSSWILAILVIPVIMENTRAELNAGLEFPFGDGLGATLEVFANTTLVGNFSYGFRSGMSFKIGQ
jgi:hypothetical protein